MSGKNKKITLTHRLHTLHTGFCKQPLYTAVHVARTVGFICCPFILTALTSPVTLIALTTVLSLTGCTESAKIRLAHVQGMLAAKQEHKDTAIRYFFDAKTRAAAAHRTDLSAYADFALGSIYLLKNEDAAAQEKFAYHTEQNASAARTLQPLFAAAYYQQGIIAFRMQHYDQATNFFKKALELDGNDLDAKINYELSKQFCIREQSSRTKPSQKAPHTQPRETAEDTLILNIISKREHLQWQQHTQSAANDY